MGDRGPKVEASILRLAQAIHMVGGEKGLKPGCHTICQQKLAA